MSRIPLACAASFFLLASLGARADDGVSAVRDGSEHANAPDPSYMGAATAGPESGTPAARPLRKAKIEIDRNGDALQIGPHTITELTPEQFYKAVGRDDLAVSLRQERKAKTAVVVSGAVLAGLGSAALFADLVYDMGSLGNCSYAGQTNCSHGYSPNAQIERGLAIGGALGVTVGAGALLVGLLGVHPDAEGEQQRRDLAEQYNARAGQAGEPATRATAEVTTETPRQLASRSLETLRVAPLISAQTRGVTLGVSF